MPVRNPPLVTGETYHIMSRGVGGMPIFETPGNYRFFLKVLDYYRYSPPVRFGHFRVMPQDDQVKVLKHLQQVQKPQVSVFCFCLMPNHFHFLVRQVADVGISTWMRKSLNSYASAFNQKNNRRGTLYQGPFKAVRVVTDEQLLHVSRYIHINPYVGHVVGKQKLLHYPWSSLSLYLNGHDGWVYSDEILRHFTSAREYKDFLLDEADYKRQQKDWDYLSLE